VQKSLKVPEAGFAGQARIPIRMLVDPMAHSIQHMVEAFCALLRISTLFPVSLCFLQGFLRFSCEVFFQVLRLLSLQNLGVVHDRCELCLLHLEDCLVVQSFEFS